MGSLVSIIEPPPKPILITSGIAKLVLTSATITEVPANLGNPSLTSPTSVVVPPTAFSLSRRPIPPILLLRVILRSGISLVNISKASCSISPLTVAKTELIAI